MKIGKIRQHPLLDCRGEMLVETLGAVLVAALSIALLFTCVMASNKINSQARTIDENYYNALSGAEIYEESETAEISVGSGSGGASATFPVQLYSGSGAGKGIYSYKEAP